jgi:hypothetical protein
MGRIPEALLNAVTPIMHEQDRLRSGEIARAAGRAEAALIDGAKLYRRGSARPPEVVETTGFKGE